MNKNDELNKIWYENEIKRLKKIINEEVDRNKLIVPCIKAAIELLQTYNSGLTLSGIKTRMVRIADDLKNATEEQP